MSSVEWLDFCNDSEGVLMSFISRSLLFLCKLSFMYVDYVVFITLYTRRDPVCFYMLGLVAVYYTQVELVLFLYFFVSLFRLPRYTDLYLQCLSVRLTSGL